MPLGARRGTRRGLPGRPRRKTQKVTITKKVPVKPMKDTQKAQVISLMRKMIGKEVENKEIGNSVELLVNHNSAISNPDLRSILPEIASGTDGQTRLGDRIKPKSLRVRGVVAVRSDIPFPSNKVLLVRVIIASQKDVKVGGLIGTATDPSHLLRAAVPGSGVEIPFNGNRNELLYEVNDNKFKVYMDHTWQLAPSTGGTGVEAQPKSYFPFTYTFTEKQMPAHLSFDEGNGDWANNFAPFLAIGYAYADGTAPDTIPRITSDVYSLLSYEDA